MTILKSFDVQSLLTYSTIEPDPVPSYINTSSYPVDYEVEYNGKIYVSMGDDNIGNIPEYSPLRWDYDRPANTTALFDDYPSTTSINNSGDIVLEFDNDDANLLALSSLKGSSILIEIIDKTSGVTLYSENKPLIAYNEPQDIYDYFFIFEDPEEISHYIGHLPSYFGSTLRVTISTDTSGVASIGFIQFGTSKNLGCTMRDSVRVSHKSGIELQRIDGKLRPVSTVGYTTMSMPVYIHKLADIHPIRKELTKYRGKPLVVLGDDTGENLAYVMIGMYTEIEESISTYGEYTINVNSMDEII